MATNDKNQQETNKNLKKPNDKKEEKTMDLVIILF
jgi:hypothetical protein